MANVDKNINLNFNDISIFEAIIDRETKRGLLKSKGTSVKEINEKTNFSLSKIRSTLQKFIKLGWVVEGVKDERIKLYCVTEKGFDGINELTDLTVVFDDN